MSQIIFLDMDGVMNSDVSVSYYHRIFTKCHPYKHLDPMCVENLRYIISKIPSIQFVISSSWRHGCHEENRNEILTSFNEQDLILPLHTDWHTIRHWTIDKNFIPGRKPERYSVDWRGNEISEWLSRHKEISQWICLDDDSDFFPLHNLIVTNNATGLTRNEAKLVIAYFTNDRELLQMCKSQYKRYNARKSSINLRAIKKFERDFEWFLTR